MQYRRFGRLDFQVSALGFGCMRLPVLGSQERIDEPQAIRLIRRAIDCGLNYLDTAYPYHGGNSERVVGKALQDGYRRKVWLATKLPSWLVKEQADFDRFLNEQLARLRTDTIDCYLFHILDRRNWPRVRDLGGLEWAQRAIADGRIRHLGFSFHDEYPLFRQIVDASDRWEFCQIQYNYMDSEIQAGRKGLRYAASRGLAVVVMEPLQGGNLAAAPPAQVQALWDGARRRRSPADWALQWLWDQPEVATVLSGMSAMEQVQQNLASAEAARAGSLLPEERELVERVREAFQALRPVPCTSCFYCLPCPRGVDIPENFGLYASGVTYGRLEEARRAYSSLPEGMRASRCEQCRECEERCPQGIRIGDWMPIVHGTLGEGREP